MNTKPVSRTLAQAAKLGLKLQDFGVERPRSSSECSTVSELSGSSRSRCTSASSFGSEPPSPSVSQALLIFDWDDTLMPTTWYREFRSCGSRDQVLDAQLRRHARQVEATLRAARRLGPVAIVTLARPNWLAATAKELPGLDIDKLFAELEIKIYYSRDEHCPGAWERGDYEALKRASMERCIQTWSMASRGARPSVLSIGDSTVERDALKGLLGEENDGLGQPLCKTLKLLDEPRMSELTEQLRQLSQCLVHLVTGPRNCSISIDDAATLEAQVQAGL
jgi:hypothetical protein